MRQSCATNAEEVDLCISFPLSAFFPSVSLNLSLFLRLCAPVSNKCLRGVARDNDTTVSVVPPVSGGPRSSCGGPARSRLQVPSALTHALVLPSRPPDYFFSPPRGLLIKFETQGPPIERHGGQLLLLTPTPSLRVSPRD